MCNQDPRFRVSFCLDISLGSGSMHQSIWYVTCRTCDQCYGLYAELLRWMALRVETCGDSRKFHYLNHLQFGIISNLRANTCSGPWFWSPATWSFRPLFTYGWNLGTQFDHSPQYPIVKSLLVVGAQLPSGIMTHPLLFNLQHSFSQTV